MLRTAAILCFVVSSAGNAAADELTSNTAVKLTPRRGLFSLAYTNELAGDLEEAPTDLGVQSFHARGAYPFAVGGATALRIGANYRYTRFSVNDLDTHVAGVSFGVVRALNDRWMVSGMVNPNLASDFEDVDGDDVLIKGNVVFGWSGSETSAYYFGVALNKDFGAYRPVPILGFAHRVEGSPWSVAIMLPRIAEVSYRVHPRVAFHAVGQFEGETWNMNANELVSDYDAKYQSTRVGLAATVSVTPGVDWRVFAGVTPTRKIVVRDDADQEFDSAIDPAPAVFTSLTLTRALLR